MKRLRKQKFEISSRKEEGWRRHLHDIIFEADTPAGKAFDISLLILIVLSVIVVMLDSDAAIQNKYGDILMQIEWTVTILFTLEYLLRIYTTKQPGKYIFSFFGIIDLLAILPTYISLFVAGSHYLVIVRILRLLRIFRILKLVQFMGASQTLMQSLKASRHKIFVFLGTVLTIVTIMGSIMYIIEGPERGYTNIPISIYWAIVTLTTVGYGDIAPYTNLGKILASMIMILGYAIIAVPTGIITAELTKRNVIRSNTQCCSNCNCNEHDDDATHCKKCGQEL